MSCYGLLRFARNDSFALCVSALQFLQIVRNRNRRRFTAFYLIEVRAMAIFGRKSRPSRRRTNQPAWMTIDGSFATRQCIVVDISEGGARLRVDDPQFVKPRFHLKFERTSPGRACKVSWTKGDLIGIEFV
jgi:hypothetical protein